MDWGVFRNPLDARPCITHLAAQAFILLPNPERDRVIARYERHLRQSGIYDPSMLGMTFQQPSIYRGGTIVNGQPMEQDKADRNIPFFRLDWLTVRIVVMDMREMQQELVAAKHKKSSSAQAKAVAEHYESDGVMGRQLDGLFASINRLWLPGVKKPFPSHELPLLKAVMNKNKAQAAVDIHGVSKRPAKDDPAAKVPSKPADTNVRSQDAGQTQAKSKKRTMIESEMDLPERKKQRMEDDTAQSDLEPGEVLPLTSSRKPTEKSAEEPALTGTRDMHLPPQKPESGAQ